MVVVIKKGTDLNKIKKYLNDRSSVKKFDAKSFCGLLKTSEDALKIQHRLRDEWE